MKRLERISNLKAAGLGTMMAESGMISDCRNKHSEGPKRGWKFCPHCGEKLELLHTCPTCKHDFYSEAAWNMHKTNHRPVCPECRERSCIHVLPRGLKFKNSGPMGRGAKYRCTKCGTLFAWSTTGLYAKKLVLDEMFPIPLTGPQVVNNGQ